jgi:L-cystine uptake protein TcyP (sodium:dicarboxylate symporter family)
MSLTKKILIGMTLGLALGVLFQVTDLVSNAFIEQLRNQWRNRRRR